MHTFPSLPSFPYRIPHGTTPDNGPRGAGRLLGDGDGILAARAIDIEGLSYGPFRVNSAGCGPKVLRGWLLEKRTDGRSIKLRSSVGTSKHDPNYVNRLRAAIFPMMRNVATELKRVASL